MFTSTFIPLLSIVSLVTASVLPKRHFDYGTSAHIRNKRAYTIKNNYEGDSFFSDWNWFTSADPTHGLVNYVSEETATSAGLAYVNSKGQAYMKVDNTSSVPAGGNRNSVRIETKATVVENDLVIFDAAHVPFGCSWMTGTEWPTNGEIDIFEGVNGVTENQMTLHTVPGCTHDGAADTAGKLLTTDCSVSADNNVGCAIKDIKPTSYGAKFAGAGGGVWAMQWAHDGIFMWHFDRENVPKDITQDAPNPANWGTPMGVRLDTTCDLRSTFGPQTLVFDITICGDWAGQEDVYQQTCSGTCSDAVATASNYDNAYFLVNSVKVYHQ